jgi:hypothetical protein
MIWSLFFALFLIVGGAILVFGGIALIITVITGPSEVAEYKTTDEKGRRDGLGVTYP